MQRMSGEGWSRLTLDIPYGYGMSLLGMNYACRGIASVLHCVGVVCTALFAAPFPDSDKLDSGELCFELLAGDASDAVEPLGVAERLVLVELDARCTDVSCKLLQARDSASVGNRERVLAAAPKDTEHRPVVDVCTHLGDKQFFMSIEHDVIHPSSQ